MEQKLGIKSKAEIEQYGIERFNAECRDSVFAFLQEWDRLTERIGFWLDLEHAYRTLDESYIESVWWALSQIDARGLLYEGHKVVPYCPRCETTLSSHEVALGYRDVVDPSVFLKLPVLGGVERLLVWTTTPWTLPGNVAVAVSPTASYALVRAGGESYLLAEDRVEAVLGEQTEVLERISGTELAERYGSYEGPIFDIGEPGELSDPDRRVRDDRGRHRRSCTWRRRSARMTTAWRGPPSSWPSTRPGRARCPTRCGRTAPSTRPCGATGVAPTRAASSRTRRSPAS